MRKVAVVALLVVVLGIPTQAEKRRVVRQPAPPSATAVNDSYSTGQGVVLLVPAPGVLANDTPNGASIVSYGVNGGEQHSLGTTTLTAQGGIVSIAADGSVAYNPPGGFSGSDSFKYVLGSSTAQVTITVQPPAPTAANDAFTTPQNQQLNVTAPGILANDVLNAATIRSYGAGTGAEQTTLGAATPSSKNGTVRLNGDGSFSYNPPTGFTGSDSFVYVVANAAGSATAIVTITVQGGSAPDFTVTSPGFFYVISGLSGENPVLTLTRGRTYTFKIDTDDIHPFEILNAQSGTVDNNDISFGTLTFAVPAAAQDYRYHCSIHNFGNTIKTVP